MSFRALISHKKFQHDSSTPSWSKFEIGPSVNLRPLFNSNMTKIFVIKWSQNCTRTIRSGVVGIPKYLKNACKAGYLNIFGYAKNTTSDGPSFITGTFVTLLLKIGLRFSLGPS